MIDAEVMRLRRLRNAVLKARALAEALDSSAPRRNSVFSRSAASCWQMARVISGRLRAHPYPSYQRPPGSLRTWVDELRARVLARMARDRKQRLRVLAGELHGVARELDDARALTWSTELSDTFGRSQIRMRRLIAELDGVRRVPVLTREIPEGDVEGSWPYLAF